MNKLGISFRTWINKQEVMGTTFEWLDPFHARIRPDRLPAYVTFMPARDGNEVVELRIQRSPQARPSFLVHLVLNDEWRAHALFREMAHALEVESKRGPIPVLVCHPDDEPRDRLAAFVSALSMVERTLSLAFEFRTASVCEALADHSPYAAIMLTPSASAHQREVHKAHEEAVVFCLPAASSAPGDATRALRLMLEALGEIDVLAPEIHLAPRTRTPLGRHKVLLLNVMYCDRCVRMGWRVYQGMRRITSGKITKSTLRMEDIEDLMSTLYLYGVDASELDGIAILVPGVVNFCSTNLPSLGDRDQCVHDKLVERYGIPVLIENNTNAAAMGCYLLQDEYENISLYRHQLGHKNGGQGTVMDGRLVAGRYGMAGEPKFYQHRFSYEQCFSDLVWTERGLRSICQNVLLATVGTIEPDALYVAVSTMDDIAPLREELERALPKYCMPDLHMVSDYRERMYLGGAALCEQLIERKRRR